MGIIPQGAGAAAEDHGYLPLNTRTFTRSRCGFQQRGDGVGGGPSGSREPPEGQDREGSWQGPALTFGAEGTGRGQGSHTFPVSGQRTNSIQLSPLRSQPQLPTKAAKDNTGTDKLTVHSRFYFHTTRDHTGVGAACRPLSCRGKGEAGKTQRVRTKDTHRKECCYSHFTDEDSHTVTARATTLRHLLGRALTPLPQEVPWEAQMLTQQPGVKEERWGEGSRQVLGRVS